MSTNNSPVPQSGQVCEHVQPITNGHRNNFRLSFDEVWLDGKRVYVGIDTKVFERWLDWCKISKPHVLTLTLNDQLCVLAGLRDENSQPCE